MIVTAVAPGKVTLFGEHAIVYGYPAIVCSISKYVTVKVRERDDGIIKIHAHDINVRGVSVVLSGGDVVGAEVSKELSMKSVAYVSKAVEVVSEYLGKFTGAEIHVSSEMPVGAGLGTSAAVSVATVAAYSTLLGAELSLDTIAKLGWEVEKRVQGMASPMDTAAATYGGFLIIRGEGQGRYLIRSISTKAELPIVIGYVRRERTTAEMVRKVRELRTRYLSLVDSIMRAIGEISERAAEALRAGDVATLGDLMNINNGLLEALGVSTKELSLMVHAALSAGALGAKITGAGGGGCIVALAPHNQEAVEAAIKMYADDVIKARIGVEGVKVTTHQ